MPNSLSLLNAEPMGDLSYVRGNAVTCGIAAIRCTIHNLVVEDNIAYNVVDTHSLSKMGLKLVTS